MTNPLLTPFELPPFSKILPEHVVPAVTKALNDCRENVERVVAQGAPYTWENLCQPLAEVDDVLGRIFSPVSHLNSVKNSPELREAYEQTLPLLSEYSTWVGQHEGLYKAYRDLRDGDHYATLNTAQKKAVETLRTFTILLAPFAPHIGEELWQELGGTDSVFHSQWPECDEEAMKEDEIEIAVQINGKTKAVVCVAADIDKDSAIAAGKEAIADKLTGTIVKEIYVPGKIINIVQK